jgi:hypothetical protein
MFIVMPSDPTTLKASEYLESIGVRHRIMDIPSELGYKTTANTGIYLEGDNLQEIMLKLSAQGFVIMRVFKSFEIC